MRGRIQIQQNPDPDRSQNLVPDPDPSQNPNIGPDQQNSDPVPGPDQSHNQDLDPDPDPGKLYVKCPIILKLTYNHRSLQ